MPPDDVAEYLGVSQDRATELRKQSPVVGTYGTAERRCDPALRDGDQVRRWAHRAAAPHPVQDLQVPTTASEHSVTAPDTATPETDVVDTTPDEAGAEVDSAAEAPKGNREARYRTERNDARAEVADL
jgi:hypothetical protein